MFREAADEKIYPTMFFGFDATATNGSSKSNGKIQVWKLLTDVNAIFPVKEILSCGFHRTSIDNLSMKYLDLSEKDAYYLNVKQKNTSTRQSLIRFLNKNSITAWVTSVEQKVSMELFLFDNPERLKELITFVGYAQENSNIYDFDYFKYVRIIINPAKIQKDYNP